MSRKSISRLLLTRQALRDIQGIFDFSVQQWGTQTADKYLDELEAGLERLTKRPDLLKPVIDLPTSLVSYRVNKHVIVCDTRPHAVVVLTVLHSSMDITSRLAELQPALAAEVEILHQKLLARRTKKP